MSKQLLSQSTGTTVNWWSGLKVKASNKCSYEYSGTAKHYSDTCFVEDSSSSDDDDDGGDGDEEEEMSHKEFDRSFLEFFEGDDSEGRPAAREKASREKDSREEARKKENWSVF